MGEQGPVQSRRGRARRRVHLLARCEDRPGPLTQACHASVLAVSDDGIDFAVEPEPVLQPDGDEWDAWEGAGGCEDPRVVETPEGGFVCTYTGFDGKVGTLMVATSDDLRTWTKHGPAFAGTLVRSPVVEERRRRDRARDDDRLVAARVDGRLLDVLG